MPSARSSAPTRISALSSKFATYGAASSSRASPPTITPLGSAGRVDDPTAPLLPTGQYVATVSVGDGAGNRHRSVRRLEVSAAALVEDVWSTTVVADQAASYNPYYGGCNGCGDFCSPTASGRFAGGLSFGPCDNPYFFGTARHFSSRTPFDPAPGDRYRITATGGPSTPGADAAARLVVGERTVVPLSGDSSTVSPWENVDLLHEPNLPAFDNPVVWYVGSRTGSYDCSFTIEYRHFVPAT